MPTQGELEMIREAVQHLPKGFCIVPVEPTQEMVEAMIAADTYPEAWRDALAASPLRK